MTTAERPAVSTVSRFEANLLTILQGFLGHVPRSQVLPLLTTANVRPPCLSREAVRLAEDALAKGTTLLLAEGGWRNERFLRDGQIARGRLWQRTPPAQLGLPFSAAALDFLIWATAAACDNPRNRWSPPAKGSLALGDRWLLGLAYETVRGQSVAELWSQREPWRRDPLCRLLFAADFEPLADAGPIDFAPWLTPAGAAVLEALQSRLAERWIAMELARRRESSAVRQRAIGASQAKVLEAFLAAIARAGRRDLARWLLAVMRRLLSPGMTLAQWVGEVDVGELRMADRQETYRQSIAVLAAFRRLEAWQHEARGVAWFDEGYQAAQLGKADWEAYNGDSLAAEARRLMEQAAWG